MMSMDESLYQQLLKHFDDRFDKMENSIKESIAQSKIETREFIATQKELIEKDISIVENKVDKAHLRIDAMDLVHKESEKYRKELQWKVYGAIALAIILAGFSAVGLKLPK